MAAAAEPVFNPNQPYSVVPPAAQPAAPPVQFNPNQPYSVVPPASQPQQANVPVIDVGGSPNAPMGQPGSQFAPSQVGNGSNVIPPGAPSAPASAPQQQAPAAVAAVPGAAPGPTYMGAPPSGPQPPTPTYMGTTPQPPSPARAPAQPPGTPIQGAADAAFAALDGIPGVNQIGAATDAALGYKIGLGSQAETFGQRYQQNLAANLAHLQTIPAALRIPAEVVGAVPAYLAGGAAVGGLADAAASAVPAAAPALNALSAAPAAVRAAAAGAAQGGVQGASDAQTNADIVPNALTGAGIGAATGAAFPVVTGALGSVGQAASDFVAPFTKSGQQRLAGQVMTNAASDPAAAQAALTREAAEIVPGSPRTTAQMTGDKGLLSLEKANALSNGEAYADVREQQNTARRSVIDLLQGSGDPMDVVNLARAHRQAIDQTTQQLNDVATWARGNRTAAIGDAYDPAAPGAKMQDSVVANETAARKAEGQLHEAIDPDGTLGMDATPIRKAAKDILGSMTPSAAPLSTAERHILETAAGYKSLMPYRDVGQLSSTTGSAMRQELRTSGRTPTYARLSRFKAALESAMDETVERRAAKEAEEVAAGERAPANTIAGRLGEQSGGEVRDVRPPVGGGQDAQQASGGGLDSSSGRVGQAGPVGQQSGTEDGNPSLQNGQASGLVDWDAAAQARRSAANAATRERVSTYNSGPVGQITRRGEGSDQLRVSPAQVPGAILRKGPTGLDALNAFEKAGGDMGAARDALAMQARHELVNADGSLNLSKLAAFRNSYSRVLSHPAMQPLNEALKNGESAELAVQQAAARTKQITDQFNASALARVIGAGGPEDVSRTIGSMFGTKNSTALFKSLAEAVKDNPSAADGARRAIVDHIRSKFISNTEVGTSGETALKADGLATFMRQNHESLRQFFTGNQVRSLQDLAEDMRSSARSMNAIRNPGGSDTAQLQAIGRKHRLVTALVGQLREPGIAGILGGEGGGTTGVLLGVAGGAVLSLVRAMRNAGLSKVEDLVTEGLLHPQIGRALMAKVSDQSEPHVLNALSHAVTRAAAVNLAGQAQR